MPRKVLITGGAGFIGSHLIDRLLAAHNEVRVLDNLSPQVHGDNADWPAYLAEGIELMRGDVRDAAAVARALDGVDSVVHLAAAVGVGQSMYEIKMYTDINCVGTAVLLEQMVERHKDRPFERLVVASSMSIYGEGLYRTADGRTVGDAHRTAEQLHRAHWEPVDEQDRPLEPVPTPESKQPALNSVYALTKYDQERLCLMTGQAYGIPAVALRFFNVYGTRQSLSNPYTGVLAIFASRLLNGHAPIIFEDGRQQRDFVHVRDIAQACQLALEREGVAGAAYNVGGGRPYSILEIAGRMGRVMGKASIEPLINGKCRVGDIRHCYADISQAGKVLGYKPSVAFDDGLAELAEWLGGQSANDTVEAAHAELRRRGLAL